MRKLGLQSSPAEASKINYDKSMIWRVRLLGDSGIYTSFDEIKNLSRGTLRDAD